MLQPKFLPTRTALASQGQSTPQGRMLRGVWPLLLLAGGCAGAGDLGRSIARATSLDLSPENNNPPLISLDHRVRPAAPMGVFPAHKTFSVRVRNVPAVSLVDALSQSEGFSYDADLCADTRVSLALQATGVESFFERLGQVAGLRIERKGAHWQLGCNSPYLKTYRIDYPATERIGSEWIQMSSQLGAGGSGAHSSGTPGPMGAAAQSGVPGANGAQLTLQNKHQHRFWDQLKKTVEDMVQQDDWTQEGVRTVEKTVQEEREGTALLDGRSARTQRALRADDLVSRNMTGESTARSSTTTLPFKPAPTVMTHPESGLMVVRASHTQHMQIGRFVEQVHHRALKQVLIEATVAEIQLNEQYQKGIQWRALQGNAQKFGMSVQLDGAGSRVSGLPAGSGVGGTRFTDGDGLTAPGQDPAASVPGLWVLKYLRQGQGSGLGVGVALSLLEGFGQVKVISHPKLLVLNQQTALMKVVDNRVYFTVQVQTTAPNANSAAFSTFNTQVHTVPVGFFMSVTPHVEDGAQVSLVVRPSVSRIVGFSTDPNPSLAQAGVVSRIPEIQTREIESVLRLNNGDVALLGGLMQTAEDAGSEGLPGVPKDSWLDFLTGQQRREKKQTELVILLRPLVQPAWTQTSRDALREPNDPEPARGYTGSATPNSAAQDQNRTVGPVSVTSHTLACKSAFESVWASSLPLSNSPCNGHPWVEWAQKIQAVHAPLADTAWTDAPPHPFFGAALAVDIGQQLLAQKLWAEARERLHSAAAMWPNARHWPQWQSQMAVAHAASGHLQQAYTHLEQAKSLCPAAPCPWQDKEFAALSDWLDQKLKRTPAQPLTRGMP